MSCGCKKLKNGVSDVYGFGYERTNTVVVSNNSQDNHDLCQDGCRMSPQQTWLISKEWYESTPLSRNSKIKVLARFGAKQQLLKS